MFHKFSFVISLTSSPIACFNACIYFFVCFDKRTDPQDASDVSGQSVQVRPLQFPMQQLQQTVPVQVPATVNNGQTIYHTVHFPIQALSNVFNVPTAQMIPQITQVRYILCKSLNLKNLYLTSIFQ